MNQNISSLKKSIVHAAEKAERWMLKHLKEEDILNQNPSDPVRYYKWPLALVQRGKNEEAGNIIEWINRQCLTGAGDYQSSRTGFHDTFHHYSNLWITVAANRLGNIQLVEKLLGFILQFHNKETGGLATFPANADKTTEDPVSTAFLGWVACETGDKSLADSVIPYFERLLKQNAGNKRFWLRLDAEGALIQTVPEDADPKTYVIHLGEAEQCYYFLGAACYFFARYMEAFDDTPLTLAKQYAGLLEKAGEKALNTIWAAKVAPGCVALYSVTRDERFLNIAPPVIQAVLKGQHPEGYWVKNGKPWITLTPEQCFWLSDMSGRVD
ncbi:MAG: hypothetical protein KGY69_03895 [Bacteroidales bacterium]|nr:hypothetical protein [Bacteroidales bacterium]